MGSKTLSVAGTKFAANANHLNLKYPDAKADFDCLSSQQLTDDILREKLRRVDIIREIKEVTGEQP